MKTTIRLGVVSAAVMILCGGGGVVRAQVPRNQARTSVLDASGNARDYRRWFQVTALQDPIALEQIRLYQRGYAQIEADRVLPTVPRSARPSRATIGVSPLERTLNRFRGRSNPRGSFLPGLSLSSGPPRRTTRRPTSAGSFAPSSDAMSRYGGFRPRRGRGEALDFERLLERRTSMITATSLNAYVERANQEFGLAPRLTRTRRIPPVGPKPVPLDPGDAAQRPKLSALMAASLDELKQQSLEKGWELFSEGWSLRLQGDEAASAGRFRQAATRFGSAAALERENLEAKTGRLLSYASMRSYGTVGVLLGQLVRDEKNPFGGDFDLVSKFPRALVQAQGDFPRSADRLLVETDLGALLGLNSFLHWHLGRRDEAIAKAYSLAALQPGTPFEQWPRLMSQARSSGEGKEDR